MIKRSSNIRTRFIVNQSRPWKRQIGVALIQVLLITSIIALLGIQFSKTALDQIEIAAQLENKVRAQLAAYSAMNEVIFLNLSDSFDQIASDSVKPISVLPDRSLLNLHGSPIAWRDGVIVILQDLNGLLPQMFPTHFLWNRFLKNHGESESQIREYFGIWTDMLDPDKISWREGESEPDMFARGGTYLNGYPQNNAPMNWVFRRNPELLGNILTFSDVDSPYDTNIFNAPKKLLQIMFDTRVVDLIVGLREKGDINRAAMNGFLPQDINGDFLSILPSGRYLIEVEATMQNSSWTESRKVILDAAGRPPFRVLSIN